MKKRNVVFLGLLACLLSGCAGTKNEMVESIDILDVFAKAPTKIQTATETVVSPEELPEETQETGNVTLAFTGDVYLSNELVAHYEGAGVNGFLDETAKNTLLGADYTIINHEYASTERETKVEYQLFTFKAPGEREKILKEMGVDLVALANNHVLDYGEEGLLDTLQNLSTESIPYIGAGKDIQEAKAAHIVELKGKKMGFVAASRFVPNWSWYALENKPGVMITYESTKEYQMLLEEIKRLKEVEFCDFVTIYVHFGVESTTQIDDYQKNLSYSYIDAGADLVVGTHAHVLQGIEFYQGKPILYNLGNFLFANYPSMTGIYQIEVMEDNTSEVRFVPCNSALYRTQVAVGEEADKIFRHLESISTGIKIDELGRVKKDG